MRSGLYRRVPPTVTTAATAVLALCLAPACSFVFTSAAPERISREEPDCSTNRVAPAVDTVIALANVAVAIAAASTDNSIRFDRTNAVILSLGTASFWGLSAGYGFTNASDCEEAIGRHRELHAQPEDGSSTPAP